MSRKTYTSCEVKDRWNKQHYDSVTFRAGKGSSEYITMLAEELGMSKAEYIRSLIVADAMQRGHQDAPCRMGNPPHPIVLAYNEHTPKTPLQLLIERGLI